MAVEEHRRIALHRAAAETWGEEVADTLVDLVVPSGDVPTRGSVPWTSGGSCVWNRSNTA
jgi:hypothetical protein